MQRYQALFTAMHENREEKILTTLSASNTCSLYPHQKESISKMLFAWANGVGIGLFDDMGMGKTLEILMTIKSYNQFPVLINCPAILMKNFKNELINKCGVTDLNVNIYHGSARKLPANLDRSIVITSVDTLKSELRNKEDSQFKRACGYLLLSSFLGSIKDIEDKELSDLISHVQSQYCELIKDPIIQASNDDEEDNDFLQGKSKSAKKLKKVKYNIIRLPSDTELKLITKHHGQLSIKAFAKIFLSKYLWHCLEKNQIIDQYGAINDEESVNCALEIIESDLSFAKAEYSTYLSIKLANNTILTTANFIGLVKELSRGFAWKLICSDEAHNAIKRNTVRYRYMQHILQTAASRRIPRILATGTPITNNYQDIFDIHDMLNPGSLGLRKIFLDRFNNIFKVVLDKIHDEELMLNAANIIPYLNDAYQKLVQIAQDLKKRSVRHQCDDLQVLANMNQSSSNGSHKRMPRRVPLQLEWHFSDEQMKVLKTSEKFTKENIERACRVYSFIHPEKEKDVSDKDAITGLVLLRELEKLTYHPVLVSHKYKNKFYSSGLNKSSGDSSEDCEEYAEPSAKNSLDGFQLKMQLIRDIISKEYEGNIDLFIAAPGRLKAIIDHTITALNKNDHYKVLIPVSSIPFAAMIQVTIEEKIKQGAISSKTTQPLVFIGALSESQREQNKNYFNNGTDHRVCILSAGAGGVGISLYADEVIPGDSLLSPAAMRQAIARAFRLDSPHEEITVCELKGTDPFSIKIERLLKNKSDWIDFLVDKGEKNILWLVEQLKNYCLTNPDYNSSADNEKFYNQLFEFIRQQLLKSAITTPHQAPLLKLI